MPPQMPAGAIVEYRDNARRCSENRDLIVRTVSRSQSVAILQSQDSRPADRHADIREQSVILYLTHVPVLVHKSLFPEMERVSPTKRTRCCRRGRQRTKQTKDLNNAAGASTKGIQQLCPALYNPRLYYQHLSCSRGYMAIYQAGLI